MTKKGLKQKGKRWRITFSLEAPDAKEVILMGDFNQWNSRVHPMKKDEIGVWNKVTMLTPGVHEYKFLVDGQWHSDPNNDQVCPNCFGTFNNVVTVGGK